MEWGEIMPALTIEQAAKRLKVTKSALSQWVYKEKIPSEKVGRHVCIEEDVLDSVAALREEHGSRWSQHAPWNGAGGGSDESESDESDSDSELPGELNSEILKLAKKYRQAGHADIACRLQDIVLEQYEF
jgi:excisionase family DNA binding protein